VEEEYFEIIDEELPVTEEIDEKFTQHHAKAMKEGGE